MCGSYLGEDICNKSYETELSLQNQERSFSDKEGKNQSLQSKFGILKK